MKTVLQYLRPQYVRLALQLTIKFIGTITELFLPWMLSHILDDVVPQKDMSQVYLWGIFMLLAATVALLGNVIAALRKNCGTMHLHASPICPAGRSTVLRFRR